MSTIEKIAELAHQHSCKVRLKLKTDNVPGSWAVGIGLPTHGYIELNGSWPFREVKWLEIKSVITMWVGRLIKPRHHDYTDSLISLLQAEQVSYTIVESMLRIPFDAVAH